MRIFGCLGYATNIKPYKGKFENRAFKCVFLGHSHGQKAYKLYNLDTKQIMVSRDVMFYEYIFPFRIDESILNEVAGAQPPLPMIDEDTTDEVPNTTEGVKMIPAEPLDGEQLERGADLVN